MGILNHVRWIGNGTCGENLECEGVAYTTGACKLAEEIAPACNLLEVLSVLPTS